VVSLVVSKNKKKPLTFDWMPRRIVLINSFGYTLVIRSWMPLGCYTAIEGTVVSWALSYAGSTF